MKILITGAAGFIGFHLSQRLVSLMNCQVIGVDNLNSYYDPQLKEDRIKQLSNHPGFSFHKTDISDFSALYSHVKENKVDLIINLAAQAGVRYSIIDPFAYQKSNLEGFLNVLEVCRQANIPKLIYASSSSVYGNRSEGLFSEKDNVDNPVSLYAATKKANELMAHTYTHLYGIQTIGLRFFTVYGPWGRPDMAYFSFLNALYDDKPIKVFNNGQLYRDFTYIDDIIDGITACIDYNQQPYNVFNLGNNTPVLLQDFIKTIEQITGKEFVKQYEPMQPGDVLRTAADLVLANKEINYSPKFGLKDGLSAFIAWHKAYYGK